jgi:hypothetical protein
LAVVEQHVRDFLVYARSHQQLTFLVTPIGCGLAGFAALADRALLSDTHRPTARCPSVL